MIRLSTKPSASPCGNTRCAVSTGIHEGLTFGSGRLDRNGYWQFPCRPCAKAWDEKHPNDEHGPAWSFGDAE